MTKKDNRGRPPNKKNNTSLYLKISSAIFLLFLICTAYIVRFSIDSFIDEAIASLLSGVILGLIIGGIIAYIQYCKK